MPSILSGNLNRANSELPAENCVASDKKQSAPWLRFIIRVRGGVRVTHLREAANLSAASSQDFLTEHQVQCNLACLLSGPFYPWVHMEK